MKGLTYLSVCSGIEAATVAWHPLGWTPVAFAEIESLPCDLLSHHYPAVPNWGDMTRFQEWPDATIDLLVGGTPCQSFSVAGLRKGLADPRGNLALTFLAITARYKPAWVVWENVPGVLSSLSHDAPDPSPPPPPLDVECDGQEMETEDEYTAEELHALNCFLAGLSELGYGWSLGIRDAQYFGVAQRRRRVFVVGHLGDWRRAGAVLLERESLSGNPAPRRESRERTAPSLAARTRGGGGLGTDTELDGGLIAHALKADGFDASEDGTGRGTPLVPEVCGTLSDGAHMGGGLTDRTPTQAALSLCSTARTAQWLDAETETFVPVIGGRFDAVPVDLRNCTMGGDVAGTLDTTRPTRGGGQAIAFSCKDHGADAGDIAPTLRSMGHDGSHANAGGQLAVAFDWQGGGKQTTLGTSHETAGAMGAEKIPGTLHHMRVRRLTPRECERLQGFPDDYTLIPRKGGKLAADGPRYKALGNSMAVPVMQWIGERIVAVEELP